MTGSELVALVESDDFRSRLAEAARTTMRTRNESSFGLFRHWARGRDYWSPVFEGSYDRVDNEPFAEWRQTLADAPSPEPHGFELLVLHFHPEHNEPLAISVEDCRSMVGPTPDNRNLVGTGSVDDQGDGYVLIMQKTFTSEMSQSMAEEIHGRYHDAVAKCPGGKTDAELMHWPGFVRADTLRLQVRPRYKRATVKNPEVMRQFAYSYTVDPLWELLHDSGARYRNGEILAAFEEAERIVSWPHCTLHQWSATVARLLQSRVD